MTGRGREGGKIAKAVTQGLDSTFLKVEMEPNPLLKMTANVPVLLCFSS